MLGTMLYIDIQKGKEVMKTSNFQKDIGGTASCIKRLMMNKNGVANWCKLMPTFMIYGTYRVVKTSEEEMAEGIYYCNPVKTSHKGSCLATLEKLMK